MPPEPQMLGDETGADSGAHAPDSARTRSAILGYFLILFLAVGLGTPIGIAAIPISYYLKDNLHLSPVELAVFVVIAGIPAYLGFLPGFVRDRFRPTSRRSSQRFWSR